MEGFKKLCLRRVAQAAEGKQLKGSDREREGKKSLEKGWQESGGENKVVVRENWR